MCNSALYHKNMDELQGDNNFFAIFNSLYLVSSDILLTHTHTHTHTHTQALLV